MSEEHAPFERRREPRVAMPPTGGAVSVVGGRIVNVSPHGMMIESPVAVAPDAVLPFRLVVKGRKADVECRVASCVARPGARRAFALGLEFTSIAPDVQQLLQDVLAPAQG